MPTYEEVMSQGEDAEEEITAEAAATSEWIPIPSATAQPEFEVPIDTVQGEEFRVDPSAAKHLSDSAKQGAAALLATPGGLPVDFLHGVANFVKQMGASIAEKGYPSYDPKKLDRSPYGFMSQTEGYRAMLFGEKPTDVEDHYLRYAGKVAEFAGGGFMPGMHIVSKAPTLATKALVAGQEVASVALGGLGMEGGGDISEAVLGEEGRGFGETIGGIAGSLIPYITPAAYSTIHQRIKAYFHPETQKAIGRQQAATLIQKELATAPDAAANLKRSEALRENIPGYSPSLGMETRAAGIQSLEAHYAQSSQEGLTRSLIAEKASIKAIQKKAKELFPDGSGDITSLPKKTLNKVRRTIKDEMITTQKQIDKLEQQVLSDIKPGAAERIGGQLKELKLSMQAKARAVKNTKYEEFYQSAEDMGLKVDPVDIKNLAKKIIDDEGITFQDKSPVLKRIIAKYVSPKKTSKQLVDPSGSPLRQLADEDISVREFHSLMKEIGREFRAASRNPYSEPSLVHQLGRMKSLFEKNLDKLKNSEFGDAATKLKEADSYFFNEYQKVFKEGIGGRMTAYNKYDDITADEDIIRNLVFDRANGIDDFHKIYGNSPESQTLLEHGIIDMFSRDAMSSGTYNPRAASNFLIRYRDTFDKLPHIKQALENRIKAEQLASNRMKILNQKLKAKEKSKLVKLTDQRNPDELISTAIKDHKLFGSLVNNIKSKGGGDGLKSLRHGVAEHILAQKDPLDYFIQNEDKLKLVYEQSHYKNLKMLAEARHAVAAKVKPKQIRAELEPKDPLSRLGSTTREYMTLMRHVYSGWISPSYAVSHAGSKALFKFRQDEMNRLVEEALYDPEVAKMLIEGVSKVKLDSATFISRIAEKIYSIGAKSVIATTNEELEE